MHGLQCLLRILSSAYRATDLERLPATIDLKIGMICTTRITLTKAVALAHEANPTCAEFEGLLVWRSGFQVEAIYQGR